MLKRSTSVADLQSQSFDLLVIGGGITGAGVALDAVTRGYSVALVEREDYAYGTSSRSSKLMHGGLRYLKNFDIALVRESLLERQLMVDLAPHLVRPLEMVITEVDGKRPDRMLKLGLTLYDLLAASGKKSGWRSPRHRKLKADQVVERVPALEGRGVTYGYSFYDCQTDDVRVVLTVLEEASVRGVTTCNRVAVTEPVLDGAKLNGVKATDTVSGEEFIIKAKNVVNATGVWADKLWSSNAETAVENVPKLRPAIGVHILLDSETLPMNSAAVVPVSDGRSIFTLPWLGSTLIGTTDLDYSGSVSPPNPPEDHIQYLLDAVNSFFGKQLDRDSITGAYAGVRPLIDDGKGSSVDASRKAQLYESSDGLLTITGGKFTTWRRMAKTVVDRLVQRDGLKAPCLTESVTLSKPIEDVKLTCSQLTEETLDHLLARYGSRADQIVNLVEEKPQLAKVVVEGHTDILAEAVYSVRVEQAESLSDVLLRRTRLGLQAADRLFALESSSVDVLANVMAEELGWSAEDKCSEVDRLLDEARSEGVVVSSK